MKLSESKLETFWNVLNRSETKEPAAAWITCIAVGSCIWIWNLPTSCCMWMRLLVNPLRFHVHFYRTLAPVRWWAMWREKFMVAMPLSSALPNVWRTRKLERKEMGWRWVQLMVCLKPLTVVGQWNKRCMYADACRNTFKTKTQSALKSLEDFTCFNIFSHTSRKKKFAFFFLDDLPARIFSLRRRHVECRPDSLRHVLWWPAISQRRSGRVSTSSRQPQG